MTRSYQNLTQAEREFADRIAEALEERFGGVIARDCERIAGFLVGWMRENAPRELV